jgi:hypothetical protein
VETGQAMHAGVWHKVIKFGGMNRASTIIVSLRELHQQRLGNGMSRTGLVTKAKAQVEKEALKCYFSSHASPDNVFGQLLSQ